METKEKKKWFKPEIKDLEHSITFNNNASEGSTDFTTYHTFTSP